MYSFLILGVSLLQIGSGLTVQSVHRYFSNAQSAARTADQRLLVTDSERHAVVIIGADHRIERTIGRKGWGNDAFDDPTDITSTFLLEILVTDRTNERVQHFDKEMVYVRTYDRNTLGLEHPLRPVACVQSNQGEIFILDADEKRVLRLDGRGRFVGSFAAGNRPFRMPIDLAITEQDKLFVLDGNEVHHFDTYGNLIGTITLTTGNSWGSISCQQGVLYIVSPDAIIVHDISTGAERTIVPADLIGVTVDAPFRSVVPSGRVLNILTGSTLYRCAFPEPVD